MSIADAALDALPKRVRANAERLATPSTTTSIWCIPTSRG
jgi:hypothetical protein